MEDLSIAAANELSDDDLDAVVGGLSRVMTGDAERTAHDDPRRVELPGLTLGPLSPAN